MAAAVVSALVGWRLAVWKLLVEPGPDEAIVRSGRMNTLPDGSSVGYRVVLRGRAFRVPLLEARAELDLTPMAVPVRVDAAYSRSNIPVLVEVSATVRISDDGETVRNAVERFLGKSRDEIGSVARETLEGHLRSVVAQRTAQELATDPEGLASALAEDARRNLLRLGLELQSLRTQHVSDDVGFLVSEGVKPYGEPTASAVKRPAFGETAEELKEARRVQDSILARPRAGTAPDKLAYLYSQASWLQRRALLGDVCSPDLEPLVQTLVHACGDKDPSTQLALADALARIGSPIGIPWLARAAESPFTGLARGVDEALSRVRAALVESEGATAGGLSVVEEVRGHLSVSSDAGRLALFEGVAELATKQLDRPRPALDVHRWTSVSPPPRRVSPMLVMDTVLWSRGKAAYGWTLVVLTVATWEIFPHDWMDGIARSSLLFTLPLFGAIMLYAAARTAVEDLKLFAYGAVTLAEVVSILPFDEFDFDIREHVSGFDYELRYVAPDGAVIETRMRRSKRIPGIEDEALEPLLHLPGVGNEEILMVDEMGSIRVRRDGGLTLRSFRSVVPLAMVAFNVWWGVAHLV